MVYILFGIAAILGLWGGLHWLKASPIEDIMKLLRWGGLFIFVTLIIFFVIYNRAVLLPTLLPLLIPWLNRGNWFGRMVFKMFGMNPKSEATYSDITDEVKIEDAEEIKPKKARSSSKKPQSDGEMSRTEALMLLGINEGASPEAIVQAYTDKMTELQRHSGDKVEAENLLNRAYDILHPQ